MSAQDVIVALRAAGQAAFKAAMDRSAESVEHVGRSADKTSKQVDDAGKKAGKSSKGWTSNARAIGGAAVAAGALTAATSYVKTATSAAVDLGEEVNKATVVFRGSERPLIAWSKTTATSLGIAQSQALEAAGVFGNMLVPMGFARRDAAAMSKRMVTMAADMASFNNASPEETLDALRAGLAGETEPLRRYGVFLNEDRIKAQALGMGLVKASKDTDKIKSSQLMAEVAQRKYSAAVKKHGKNSIEAKTAAASQARAESSLHKAMAGKLPSLTATQKAQATYALILKDTKDAQGDFQRTNESLANQQRILKAQWTNLAATVGKQVLPAALALAKGLGWLFRHTTVLIPVIALLTAGLIAYTVAQIAAAVAAVSFNAALLLIPLAVAALVAGIIIAYQKVGWFRAAVNAVWTAIKVGFGWLKTNWKTVAAILAGPFGVAVLLITKHWDAIKSGASNVLKWFRDFGGKLVRGLVDGIKSAPGAILDAIKSLLPGGKIGAKLLRALPGFAMGGTFYGGGAAVVGERGPELVSLPGGSRITPLSTAGAIVPALGGASAAGRQTVVYVQLDRRTIATAVAQDTADQKARR
jgi:hypothetical protein